LVFLGGEILPDIGVLLVEDERLLDRVVSDALRTIGVSCETVSSEEEAVRRLTERRYELVISDLRIQYGSGIVVLRHARALYPDIPVIVVTAYAADEDVYRALALGVDALLYKPFDIDTLLNTVRTLLRQRTPAEAADAVVQMPAGTPQGLCWLEVGALVTLRAESSTILGRVRHADELFLSVNTEMLEPPHPTRWTVEWTGSDALYQFEARVIEATAEGGEMLWVLRLPRLIRRIQRRRHPRVPVSGKAFVSVAGRLQRAIEAEVIDLSEGGVCLVLAEPPMRGAALHLEVQAHSEGRQLRFHGEGSVRSIVAFTQQGEPRYRVGVQLQRLPADAVQHIRLLHKTRLMRP
jgi:DNA-binding response OmpR family regulator/c-di-GMP-binding flagellar brake protein YcgR